MKKLDRRQWLRTAGLTGAFTILGGASHLSATIGSADLVHHPKTDALIRLSSNENPYGPSKRVREAISGAFDQACRYPYAYMDQLAEAIASRLGVSPDHVVLTAGSNEGLRLTGLTYGLEGGEIMAADPTYKALLSYAEQFGAYINKVPLDDQLVHDLETMDRRINHQTRLVFICNPNNPTGTLLPADRLQDFCRETARRTLVFVDEAYSDYIEEPNYPSMAPLVKEGLNVIISRTFSKVYGLAGLRMGYLIARPDIAARLRANTMAGPNVLAIFAALEALKDEEFYRFSLEKNREAKALIYQSLDALKLSSVPSHTNFVFFHTGKDVREIAQHMKDKGVLVGRPFPPLTDWCRISTGTLEDTKQFTQVLERVMG